MEDDYDDGEGEDIDDEEEYDDDEQELVSDHSGSEASSALSQSTANSAARTVSSTGGGLEGMSPGLTTTTCALNQATDLNRTVAEEAVMSSEAGSSSYASHSTHR